MRVGSRHSRHRYEDGILSSAHATEVFTLVLPHLNLIEPVSQIPLTTHGYPVTIKIVEW